MRSASTRALLALAMVVLMGVAALAGPAGLVGSASAQQGIPIENCGEELDQDDETYTVSGTPTSGNSEVPCIEVTGDNVVIEGGDGSIESEVSDESEDTGILIDGSGAEVRGLEVNEFEVGIDVDEQDATIRDVDVYDADEEGILFEAGTDGGHVVDTLVDNGETAETAEAASTGIDVRGSVEEPVLIENTEVRNAEIGVLALQNQLETIGLTVTSNDVYGIVIPRDSQVHTDLTATDNEVGVLVDGSEDVTIEDAVVQGGETGDGPPRTGIEVRRSTVVTIRNAEITGVPGYGVLAEDGSDVSIEGSETLIDDNDISGVFAGEAPTDDGGEETADLGEGEPEVQETAVEVSDATVSGNGISAEGIIQGIGGELVANGPADISASNVNVGASTAPNTRIDAELHGVALFGLDGLDAAEVPDAPSGYEALDRYVAIFPTGQMIEGQAFNHQEGGSVTADVTLHYTDGDVDGLDESTLSLWNHDGEEEWNEVDGTLDEGANAFSANLTSFSQFGLFAEEGEEPTATPEPDDDSAPSPSSDIRVESVDAPEEVEPEEAIRIQALLENVGDGDGAANATLDLDDEVIDYQNVFIGAGENRTVGYTTTFEDEGEYTFTVLNQTSVTATVVAPDDPTATATASATPTDTATATGTPTETPEPDDDGGIDVVLLVGLVLVVLAVGGGAVWYYYQQ